MADYMERLASLIALADRAENDHERELAMERAEKLSAAIGVELAVARMHAAERTREKTEVPVADRIVQVNDYSARPLHRAAMVELFCAITPAHDIRVLIGSDNCIIFCYGFESDIKVVEALFAMLSLQMVSEADAAIKRGEQKWVIDEDNRKIGVDGRVFRRNFYEGFTKTIAGRLWARRVEATKVVDDASGEKQTGTIALLDKTKTVDEFYEEQIKHRKLGTFKGVDNSDSSFQDAISAGNAAGKRAKLGLSDRDVDGSKARPLSGS